METHEGSAGIRTLAFTASLSCMFIAAAVVPAWGGSRLSSADGVVPAQRRGVHSARRVSPLRHRRHSHPAPGIPPSYATAPPASEPTPAAAQVPVSTPLPASPESPPTSEAPSPAPEPEAAPPPPAPAPEPPAPAPEPEPAPEPSPEPLPPPPTTSPPPVTSGGGSELIFSAFHLSEFWLLQSAPGAITEAPDPAGSSQTVFKLVVGDGDVYPITPTENPRAEMLSPSTIESGDEFWWSAKFFLPSDFPSSIPGWMNVMQGPYGSPFDGPPPWHIELNGTHIQWMRNGTYNWDVPWQMPLVKSKWVNVMVHERFARDGWIEMWIDGQPITFFGSGTYDPNGVAPTTRLAMETMDSSNDGATNSIYLQSYRKVGMFPSLTSYEGPMRIGTSRASVGG
jgi:hypothetical protein